MNAPERLRYFPISFFSMILGLGGFIIALERAEALWQWPFLPSPYILAVSLCLFALLSILYSLKAIAFRATVIRELQDPVQLSFFPTFSISLILFSIAVIDTSFATARYLWITGSTLHLLLTLMILSGWINRSHFEIRDLEPAWFIPVIGNMLIPIAGVQFFPVEVSWFFFTIGLVFWLALFTIIFYRVIFHQPLGKRLVPSLFILIAPPAVAFISYVSLISGLDSFARILYFTALFLTLLLVTQIGKFAQLPFFLSAWVYSFPAAAMTIATVLMYELTLILFFKGLALIMLVLLAAIVGLLLFKTTMAIARREICIGES